MVVILINKLVIANLILQKRYQGKMFGQSFLNGYNGKSDMFNIN